MVYRIGADIGGTSVKLGVVDEAFHIVESMRIPTGEICTADGIIGGIVEACRELMVRYEIASVGIGSAGLVNPKTGYVLRAGNLPFLNEPLGVRVAEGLQVPVFLDNDANCALIGEHAAGACAGYEDALILTIGTGIGGAVMIGGRVYRGHNYKAAEFGHFIINMNGEACSCGLRGCFEQYGSASALIAMTKKCVRAFPGSLLARMAQNGIDGSTAFEAAKGSGGDAEGLREGSRSGNQQLGKDFPAAGGGAFRRRGGTGRIFIEPHKAQSDRRFRCMHHEAGGRRRAHRGSAAGHALR